MSTVCPTSRNRTHVQRVCAAMTTPYRRSPWILSLAAAVLLATCAGPMPSPTSSPGAPGSVAPAPSSPAGDLPVAPGLPPGGGAGAVGGRIVVPRPGQLDVHPIAAQGLSAAIDGRHVVVTVTFASGVEPCSILDTIVVQRGVGSFAITLREGHGPGNAMCIEIAEIKRALVDLGDLDPGTYTVSDATGGAPAIEVVVG